MTVTISGDGAITGNTNLRPTGEFAFFQLTAAPAGWVAGDGTTIGDVGSGAGRANADTLALFTAWWNAYSDAQLPILTSAGSVSTRGANAAADWTALKRLTVFDVRDRVSRSAGTIQANGSKLEPTEFILPYGASSGTLGTMAADQVNGYANADSTGSRSVNYSQWTSSLLAAAALQTTRVRVASIGMLGCYKL